MDLYEWFYAFAYLLFGIDLWAVVSSKARAFGSNKTASASENRTPCFFRLTAALLESHSNSIHILYVQNLALDEKDSYVV